MTTGATHKELEVTQDSVGHGGSVWTGVGAIDRFTPADIYLPEARFPPACSSTGLHADPKPSTYPYANVRSQSRLSSSIEPWAAWRTGCPAEGGCVSLDPSVLIGVPSLSSRTGPRAARMTCRCYICFRPWISLAADSPEGMSRPLPPYYSLSTLAKL